MNSADPGSGNAGVSGVARRRNASVDYLKVLLAVMVVGLHTNVFSAVGPTWDWLTANGLFRMAVPCFLVINGYYFAETPSPGVWFKRVVRLYVVWAVLYIPFLLTAHHSREWKALTFFAGYSHLWYLPAILIAAGLVRLFGGKSERALVAASGLAFLAALTISLLGQIHPEATEGPWVLVNDVWASRNGVLFGFPLFTCGYLVRRFRMVDRLRLSVSVALLVFSVFLLLAESWVFHVTAPERGGVDVYLSIILVGPFAFILAAKMNLPGPGKMMSKMASGIYFSHFGLLILLHWIGLSGPVWFLATLCTAVIAAFVLMLVDRERLGII